jgi:transposase
MGGIGPLMPSPDGKRGTIFRDPRTLVEAIVNRVRTGNAWRDLPAHFGPWQTASKRHRRLSRDGTWDRIHTALLAHADGLAAIDWNVSVDSERLMRISVSDWATDDDDVSRAVETLLRNAAPTTS